MYSLLIYAYLDDIVQRISPLTAINLANHAFEMKNPSSEVLKLISERQDFEEILPKISPRVISSGSLYFTKKQGDKSMMANSIVTTLGGIDFKTEGLNIETKGSGVDFSMLTNPEYLNNITGVTPVIIQIIPVTDISLLLQ